ncbi:acyl-CoA thioesterase [Actinokineospora spheciospongiae]|uniref:acyl-CoA thioesterase n=1 Tax=Actinokineospora spheciospongiae TaxID=909613 RepID=UPI000D70C1B6|nr:thioesterase family protein [Actinokineospora spheciospongiae]PWW62479.1 acyl-CoA thioester hydrolase [Actinokineospora spheciospongiae]
MAAPAQTPATAVEYGHVEPLWTHFDDLDLMGMVHNTRYPVLVERALTGHWTRQGFDFVNGVYSKPDVVIVVAEFSISYRAPIRGTNPIGVHLWVEKVGQSSATYGFRVLSADSATVHAEGRRVHIRLDQATHRPTPWTDEARAVLDALAKPQETSA